MPDTINSTKPWAFLPGPGNPPGTLPPWVVWLLQVALLASAYFISGRLGLLLAIPPGYATAVWPPAGIALVGLLLFGNRAWLGVWLGSFLINITISFEASSFDALLKSLSIAGGIGAGAALQAVTGVYLIRRFVGFPNTLEHERDIAWFLLLGGPLSCLVNATIGVSLLWIFGLIPPAAYLFSWWTWWVGDVIGVLIFTPLLLIFLAAPGVAGATWRARRLSVAVPLAITFALAVLVFVLVSGQEQRRIKAVFEQRTQVLTQGLNESLGNYVQILQSIESFYASSKEVERQEFHVYVKRMLDDYPGIHALSWNPRVSATERSAYEATARRDGRAGFQFTERDAAGRLVRAAPRTEYFPVYFIEPYAGNELALGYDAGSDEERLASLHRARDTGQPVATAGLQLVQETEQQIGFMILLPIYTRSQMTETIVTRRQHLLGYAVGVFRVSDVVDAALRNLDRSGLVLSIEDTTTTADKRLLYGPPSEAGVGTAARAARTTLKIAGRQWTLSFNPTPEYLAAQRSWAAWLVLAAGLLFTALLGAFLLMLSGRTSRIENLVTERTEELKRSNVELEQFAYIASHDLQEPLRMVSSYTQLLAKRYQGRLDKDADEFIAFAVDGAARMQQLIQDLLAYSRVGMRGQEMAPIASEQCFENALANLKAAIEESHAVVTHERLPSVRADATQLTQLLQNLIGNAIKFRGDQTPKIHLSVKRNGQQWCFSVRDNGIGIEPRYQERIFVIFQRLHTREAYPGTGIGLALCKKIVQRHGGRIWVESNPGEGSNFYFTLPASETRSDGHE